MELDKQVMKSIQKTRESGITWIIDVYVLLHKLTNSEVCKGYHPLFYRTVEKVVDYLSEIYKLRNNNDKLQAKVYLLALFLLNMFTFYFRNYYCSLLMMRF